MDKFVIFHSNTNAILIFFFFMQVRNLKYLAVFSTLANCLTAASFGIIFYFIFREPIQTEGRRMYGPIEEFPLFIGIVLFSLESVGIVIFLFIVIP